MAITQIHYHIYKAAVEQGTIKTNGSILDLGEANFYGDFSIETVKNDVETLVDDPVLKKKLLDILEYSNDPNYSFHVAKVIYLILFKYERLVSIDMDGTGEAKRLDLNYPIDLGETFDIIICATLEHVFNIAQVCKTMHDHTSLNGVMFHDVPFTGWIDHGFYNIQPTFFYDIADANGYSLLGMFCCDFVTGEILQVIDRNVLLEKAEKEELGKNTTLIVILKKVNNNPFVFPTQGIYADTLDAKQKEAWKTLR